MYQPATCRVRLCSMFATVALLLACQTANAQYASDFEDLQASDVGIVITGQDEFYIPVEDSQDGKVYTYTNNALGLPANPGGVREIFRSPAESVLIVGKQ